MRVVILHESPGADETAVSFVDAANEFSRGLDIRLRFLDVGFSLREVPVKSEDDFAAVTLSETVGAFRPGVVLALGRGPRLLECASAAVKSRLPVMYLVPDSGDRSARALTRIASVAVTADTLGDRPVGAALVDTIVRSIREDT